MTADEMNLTNYKPLFVTNTQTHSAAKELKEEGALRKQTICQSRKEVDDGKANKIMLK